MKARILLFLHLFFQQAYLIEFSSKDYISRYGGKKSYFIKSLKSFKILYRVGGVLSYKEKKND